MKRSFGIDLIRTVSIIIVILRHYGITGGFNFGFYAIEFLFVVSGYLIGHILLKEFYSSPKVSKESVVRFMMRRWFRILPMYYFAIFLKFLFLPSIGLNILYYVFFLQNHFYGITFYTVTWSLVIDEWFYLTAPLLLFSFMKIFGSQKNRVLGFLLFLILSINVLRFLWVYFTDAKWAGLTGNVPFRQDTLLIGVVMAFTKMHYKDFFNALNNFKVFVSVFAIFILYVGVFYYIRSYNGVDGIDNYLWTRTINFSICAALISLTLPFIENSVFAFSNPKLGIVNNAIVMGSKISYALYLFHVEIREFIVYLCPKLNDFVFIKNTICIVASVLFSYLLYQVLEKKFLILRDKYYPDIKIV